MTEKKPMMPAQAQMMKGHYQQKYYEGTMTVP